MNDVGGPPEMYTYPPPEPESNWNDLYELEFFADKRGDWRWRVRSKVNGQIVVPPHPYTRKVDMEDVVSKLFPQAEPPLK